MKIIGASAVCEALLREGVDVIFGHPGGAILPFYDSLWHYPQLRHILVRHEQAAAHAAESYARLTGKVGVCVATSGPGGYEPDDWACSSQDGFHSNSCYNWTSRTTVHGN